MWQVEFCRAFGPPLTLIQEIFFDVYHYRIFFLDLFIRELADFLKVRQNIEFKHITRDKAYNEAVTTSGKASEASSRYSIGYLGMLDFFFYLIFFFRHLFPQLNVLTRSTIPVCPKALGQFSLTVPLEGGAAALQSKVVLTSPPPEAVFISVARQVADELTTGHDYRG